MTIKSTCIALRDFSFFCLDTKERNKEKIKNKKSRPAFCSALAPDFYFTVCAARDFSFFCLDIKERNKEKIKNKKSPPAFVRLPRLNVSLLTFFNFFSCEKIIEKKFFKNFLKKIRAKKI